MLLNERAISLGYPVNPLPDPLIISTPTQHVAAALQNFSTSILQNLIKRHLRDSPAYSLAKKINAAT